LKISEELVWELTNKAIDELGAGATPEMVKEYVERELSKVRQIPGTTEKFEAGLL